MTPAAEPSRISFGILALLIANALHTFAFVGMYTFVGDQLYRITDSPLSLGLLGAVLFLPVLVLSPIAGTIADRFDRRWVYAIAVVLEIALAFVLYLYVRDLHVPDLRTRDLHVQGASTETWPFYTVVGLFGLARAFAAPASRAMPIDLAPRHQLEKIIALKSAFFQGGIIVGPVVASFAAARSPELPYLVAIVALALTLVALVALVPKPPIEQLRSAPGLRQTFRDAADGVRYMRHNPVLFGAITLDLFAVLLGGAVALLPAIARDHLDVAEIGLGWLRAADGVGAATTATLLAFRPLRRRIGRILMISVAVFGLATIVLGVTETYAVAFLALVVLGSADAISVYIRSSVVPLATPEVMRGRVLAVENVFIGGSNELGAMESGAAGALIGVPMAVVTGGVGTLGIVALWWKFFPALRDIDHFDDVRVDHLLDDDPSTLPRNT